MIFIFIIIFIITVALDVELSWGGVVWSVCNVNFFDYAICNGPLVLFSISKYKLASYYLNFYIY